MMVAVWQNMLKYTQPCVQCTPNPPRGSTEGIARLLGAAFRGKLSATDRGQKSTEEHLQANRKAK
jgi:hypothetical protein